jgi:uncharacterized membrane protein
MTLFNRKRGWGEIIVAVMCLLLAAQVFALSRAADAKHTVWRAAYRGSTGPATPAQGYLITVLLILFALVLLSVFIFSGRA